jgi:hypothetical protein
MTRLLRSLVVPILVLLAAGVLPASAQTPAPVPGRDVPAPEECTVEPLSPEELEAIASAEPDAAAFATPSLPNVPFGAPDGEAADAETTAAFAEVVRESWACLNAGDWARFFALLTEADIRRNFAPSDILALGSSPAAPFPVDQQTAIIAILDVEVLPDGRVGGFVIVDTPGDPLPVEINYQIAAETENGLRLDGFVCFNATGGLC